jgi:integrase
MAPEEADTMTLTARAVDAAKPREKAYKLADQDGLYLQVLPTGTKSWRANFTKDGKQQTRTYGRYPPMSLLEARKAHYAARGQGPVDHSKGKAPAFRTIAKRWLLKHLPDLKNPKHRGQVEATLERFAYPKIGDLPIDDIPRTKLVEVVEGVLDDATGRGDRVETAHRVAGRVTAVFDYAIDVGIITEHHASSLTRVLPSRKTKKPMPSIPPEEAGALMLDIRSYPEPVTALALELMAYTFPRVAAFLGFEKDELREDGAVWVIPPERMKVELLHVVPMSRQARKLTEKLITMSGCQLVIESPAAPGKPLSENTLLFALYRLGYKGRMTVHGFRALASTVLNESGKFARDAIERQLAHQETDEVRAAYNRAQYLAERRRMMQWWADWLDAQATAARPARAGAAKR